MQLHTLWHMRTYTYLCPCAISTACLDRSSCMTSILKADYQQHGTSSQHMQIAVFRYMYHLLNNGVVYFLLTQTSHRRDVLNASRADFCLRARYETTPAHFYLSIYLSIYIYIYIQLHIMCMYMCIYIYIYMHIHV